MKKLFALILALVMMTALSVPAFATEGLGMDDGENIDISVQGIYKEVAESTVYSVDITWENLTFTYTETKKWDVENNTFGDVVRGAWSGSGTITVTNHSNGGIIATMRDVGENGNYNLLFDGQEAPFNVTLGAAAGGQATTQTVTVTVDNSAEGITASKTIATINVAITAQ